MFRRNKAYIKFFKENSIRKFNSYEEAYSYLEEHVFTDDKFIEHVTKSAEQNVVSYVVAYTTITEYLASVLFKIDEAISFQRKKSKFIFHSYFSLEIGFMKSMKNKKMFLEKLITKSRTDAKTTQV